MTKRFCYVAIVAIAIAALLAVSRPGHRAKKPAAAIPMNNSDIAGVVMSSKGPEAGVWVIAETKDLGTGYRKIVVTDDQGRYLIPELPKANYTVWVRGYGLVDSAKIPAGPGKPLDLKAVIAPSEKEAAQYFPAAYWYSLLHIPPKSDFPGTGPTGNGISDRIKDQGEWVELRSEGGGAVLPCRILVFAAPHSAEERFPRHRSHRKWHFRPHQGPGRVGRAEIGRRRRITSLPHIGIRCSTFRRRAISPAQVPQEMAFQTASRTRASGSS